MEISYRNLVELIYPKSKVKKTTPCFDNILARQYLLVEFVDYPAVEIDVFEALDKLSNKILEILPNYN